MEVARREGAVPYDVKGVEFGHHGQECSFDALVKKHGLDLDPALVLLAKIVRGAQAGLRRPAVPAVPGCRSSPGGGDPRGLAAGKKATGVYCGARLLPGDTGRG